MGAELDGIAVLDIGKTNVKLVVVEARSGRELFSRLAPNVMRPAPPYAHVDVEAIFRFFVEALRDVPERGRIGTLVPVVHGGAVALVAGEELALPVLDYEETAVEEVAAAYHAARDPFRETLSPEMPFGLGPGKQVFFLQERFPQAFARADKILFWPQYWAWRFCGVAASEWTYLGCHSDFWKPRQGSFSDLAVARGWAGRVPPRRLASERLGRVRPEIAAAAGLDPACTVMTGIHDSSCSFLRHRVARRAEEPFTVVSTGTWTVALANATDLDRLDPQRGTFANVSALGEIVATALFMGGREYELILGCPAEAAAPSREALARVLAEGAMALPAFTDKTGPFIGHRGRILGAEGLDQAGRAALATLYLALVTDAALDIIGAGGDLVVEGPLASNPLYAPLMGALRPHQRPFVSFERAGTVGGARLLALGLPPERAEVGAVEVPDIPGLAAHRARWRTASGEHAAAAE